MMWGIDPDRFWSFPGSRLSMRKDSVDMPLEVNDTFSMLYWLRGMVLENGYQAFPGWIDVDWKKAV